MAGKFDWLSRLGATNQAIAVLNSQPILFATLVLVLASLVAQLILLFYIHRATSKLQAQAERNARTAITREESTDAAFASAPSTPLPPTPPPRPRRPKPRSSRL